MSWQLEEITGEHARFAWSDLRQKAFEELKTALLNAPILRLANVDKEFRVVTDASDFALGAVLLQQDDAQYWHPVAFASKKLYSRREKTIQPQRKTIQPQRKTKKPQRKTIQPQRKTIKPQRKTIQPQRKTIQPQRKIIQPQREREREILAKFTLLNAGVYICSVTLNSILTTQQWHTWGLGPICQKEKLEGKNVLLIFSSLSTIILAELILHMPYLAAQTVVKQNPTPVTRVLSHLVMPWNILSISILI